MVIKFCQKFLLIALIFGGTAIFSDAQKVTGVVKTLEGKPIENVWVRPGFRTETDRDGKFVFEDASDKFLIFTKEGFRPRFVKLKDETEIEIVLQPESSADRLTISECTTANRGKTLGLYLKVFIPKEFKVGEGKDVDYTRFVIFPKTDKNNYIEGWQGFNATRGYPKTDWIKAADKISIRSIYNEKRLLGYEYRGQSIDGKYWRYIQIFEESIFYQVDSVERKNAFDQIIDGSCATIENYFQKPAIK